MAAQEPFELSLAHSYQPTQPQVGCGAQVIADEVAAADVGLTIELYGGSQLGPDADRILSVQAGDIDIDIQGASALSAIYAPISAVDGAFVFDDSEHMYNYLSREASDALKQGFYDATGVTILGGWNTGARQFTANVPIRTPEDLEGLRMRFPGSPTFLLNAEAMGAEAVAVPFEELFLALQQGTVDGQENPSRNIRRQQPDRSAGRRQHVESSAQLQPGGRRPVLGRAEHEQQTALSDAVAEAMVQEPECVTEIETEILDEWRADDTIEIVEDVDRDAFRAKAEPYLRENFTPEQIEVLDGIRSTGRVATPPLGAGPPRAPAPQPTTTLAGDASWFTVPDDRELLMASAKPPRRRRTVDSARAAPPPTPSWSRRPPPGDPARARAVGDACTG